MHLIYFFIKANNFYNLPSLGFFFSEIWEVVALVGKKQVSQGTPPAPQQTIESV